MGRCLTSSAQPWPGGKQIKWKRDEEDHMGLQQVLRNQWGEFLGKQKVCEKTDPLASINKNIRGTQSSVLYEVGLGRMALLSSKDTL